jgi:hypothetical protein
MWARRLWDDIVGCSRPLTEQVGVVVTGGPCDPGHVTDYRCLPSFCVTMEGTYSEIGYVRVRFKVWSSESYGMYCRDDGGNTHLWNVGRHSVMNTTVHPRRFWGSGYVNVLNTSLLKVTITFPASLIPYNLFVWNQSDRRITKAAEFWIVLRIYCHEPLWGSQLQSLAILSLCTSQLVWCKRGFNVDKIVSPCAPPLN